MRSPANLPIPYEMLSPTTAPRPGGSDHERQTLRSPAPASVPAMITIDLARDEREERVDHRHREDGQVAPVGARDPVHHLRGTRLHPRRDRNGDDGAVGHHAAHRHARARRDDLDRRSLLRSDPRRPRRRRDQGRASRHGRRRQGLGAAVLERRGDDVPLRQRRQALARDLAARPARARGAAAARRRRRRLPAEPPPRAGGRARARRRTHCASATRGSSTAPSARTGTSARSATSRATTR